MSESGGVKRKEKTILVSKMEEPPNPLALHDHNSDPSDKAFRIDMIRDAILDYATHDGNNVVISNVCSFRTVSKAWFQSTHRILCKSQRPLFRFSLYATEFTVGKKEGTMENENFCQFLLSLQESDPTHIPPHEIDATDYFFRQDNYVNFFHYLENYSSNLVELSVDLAADKPITDSIPANTNFLLPRLRQFTATVLTRGQITQIRPGSLTGDIFNFIQSVLDASEKLESFWFCDCTGSCFVAINEASIRLPSSLTEIDLECFLTDRSLAKLVNSPLPKLKSLKLNVSSTPFDKGMMTSVLQNVCKTLKTFSVMGKNLKSANKRPTKFQLPLMEKLEKLKIETDYLELEGNLSCLQNRLPVVKHLNLLQTNSMFRKWTDQSCFTFVESLRVGFASGDYRNNGFVQITNAELPTVESLATAFSKVQQLEIRFSGTELSALVPIMRKMTSLCRLTISVYGTFGGSNAWDAFLLGIPVESVQELRTSPDLLEELQAESCTSIRNLSNLHTLRLEAMGANKHSLISDLVFNFAFFKMPKLAKLDLMNGFGTSDKIKEKWKKEGRHIYQPFSFKDDANGFQDEEVVDDGI